MTVMLMTGCVQIVKHEFVLQLTNELVCCSISLLTELRLQWVCRSTLIWLSDDL